MKSTPTISVLMPAYNSALYLESSIESILQQSFADFEFIIIDDGSTDQTAEIVTTYAEKDSRIVFMRNAQNMASANSMNLGLGIARGKYIARMDADDISLPNRFARQVAFMDANPDIGISGTWAKIFGQSESLISHPTRDAEIKSLLFWDNPLAHPTVIMRHQLLKDHQLKYDPTHLVTEDYALWIQASDYTCFANLDEILLHYRLHHGQSGQVKRERQQSDTRKLQIHQLQKLGIDPTPDELELHFSLLLPFKPRDKDFVLRMERWIHTLLLQNSQHAIYPEPEFSKMVSWRWFITCRSNLHLGPFVWQAYSQSPISQQIDLDWKKRAKFRLLSQFPWLQGNKAL